MEIPPKKPHFFKPILPDFKNGLKIPIGFFKYLKGHHHIEHVVLRRAGKKWLVKANGRRFEDGWAEFVEQHDLELGDILVFKHERDLEFEVSIFDSSHCDIKYAEYMQIQEEKDEKVKEEVEEEEDEDEEDEDNDDDNEEEEEEEEDDEYEEAATHDKRFRQSHFECTIRQYCLSRGFLWIPKQFAFANGLINSNKKFSLIIIDERQTRSWNLMLNSCKTQAYIADGWRKFSADNCLKEGDRVLFEIVTKGETQIWKFQVVINAETPMRKFQEKPKPKIKTSGKAFSNVEAAKDMNLSRHSHFICTIKPYCLSKYFLCIPKEFAQENGLRDRKCKIIMRDEQRSWTFSVYTNGKNTYIGSGWREFCIMNCLKEGDRLMFEIVSNGEIPVFRIHDLRGSPSLQAEVKKKNLDAERMPDKGVMLKISGTTTRKSQEAASTSGDANSHFTSNIKPYSIKKPVLYLPLDFVRSNGLMNRTEMILIDEKRRSWSVWLGRLGHHFGIKSGWPQFRKANGVQVGDAYKFELTNNGTIPIVNILLMGKETRH